MDVDTRAPSPASDIIEDAADPPWVPTASPQSSSERDQTDVTCNIETAAPSLPPPLHSHACSNCTVAPSSMSALQDSSSGSPSIMDSVVGRPLSLSSFSPQLLPSTPHTAANDASSTQDSSPNSNNAESLEVEVRVLRSKVKDLEALSARLHGQLESSQQKLFKERVHHENVAELLVNRVTAVEGDNQKLRARLGEKAPQQDLSYLSGDGGGLARMGLSIGSSSKVHGHLRRASKDVKEGGKKRSSSSDPRRSTPPRHIEIDPPSISTLSSTTPKATTPRCAQDVCPIQCSQQLVVGQDRL